MSFLEVSNICFIEGGNSVLKDISFTQQKFQKIAIAGETGSGKSTLLQIVAGFVQPCSGEVLFESKPVEGPAEKLVPGHPDIAYLSQQHELDGFLRVEQVLMYANRLSAEEAETLYEVCDINHLLKRKTSQLSGGERQRIALAELLLSSPKLLLLDEPFSNLDRAHKDILKSVIRNIGEKLQITCILISHDPLDTLSWADEILVMKAGEILQQGSPEQIYRQPVNTYVAGLFGTYNLVNTTGTKAFSELLGLPLNEKNMLVRPEDFKLTSKESKALPGKVLKVNFLGSYYEIEVFLLENRVTVKTETNTLKKGDTVYVDLSVENLWWV